MTTWDKRVKDSEGAVGGVDFESVIAEVGTQAMSHPKPKPKKYSLDSLCPKPINVHQHLARETRITFDVSTNHVDDGLTWVTIEKTKF